ncbi:MAG: hypothetical protein R3202_01095, partial [Candidatus Competibacterales bacterium]|nr:hypothetical protein [Candidatus Competibacterales bacterium]
MSTTMHPGTEESIAPPDGVRIRAPARLHFGFLDLHGGLGRRYSSLGLSLEQPATALRLRRAPTLRVSGPDSDRVRDCARRLAERLGLPAAAEITVEQAIPAHAGLGSGTQLALAVGLGLARLYRRALAAREAAVLLGRGARSGIGVGAFEQGGFLIDGGHGPDTAVPPIICRLPFPEDWRLLLVYDPARAGLSGESEREAFARLPVFPPERAAQLCRLVLIRLLPALAEGDAAGFGAALAEL